jgi:cysteine-rich repeat protein
VYTNVSHLAGVPAVNGSLTGINGPSWAVRGPGGAAGNATVNVCNNGGAPPASAQYDDCVNAAPVEQCDDGNAVNGDGCDSCQISTCGDGTVDLGEDCDDGNVVGGDGCEANCTLPSVCGDGVTDPGEACDGDDVVRDSDGNSLGALPAGVTCLPDCRLSTCRSVPVAVQASESCDDGNDNNSDLCTNLCLVARCGDGIVQPTNNEECDDGNDVETDSCTNSCEFNVLGDGIRYTTETLEANPGNLHACDTGPVPAGHGARAGYRAGRDLGACLVPTATCDGDGYEDETDFCGAWDDPTPANRGVIRCAPNATARGITTWKDGDWCLMPAESHGDHGDANADDLVKASWYDAKAHCESYGLDARLVVVNTVANRTALATAADAAAVSGVANGSIAGYCEGSDEGTACAVTSEVADCDSDNCETNLTCVLGATPGAACTTDADCGGGTCEGLCTATANGGNGDACVDDNDCDGPGGVCAARMSWVGLFDDFTGNSFGGTPVSTNPGRWYWLDETLDNPQNNTTKALWKHNPGPPTDLTTHPNGDGDCAVLDQGTDATVTVGTEGWDDVSCTQARAFMCEFPLP